MDGRPVQLRIAGQSYRVVSSASEEDLQRLAETVSAKIQELTPPGKIPSSQSILLAAMALAHDLEEERAKRVSVERRARDMLRRVIGRIDDALGSSSASASSSSSSSELVEASAAEH
jgi:cell division protein ZapA